MTFIDTMKNADRFTGFVDIYDAARPAMPLFPVEIISQYLGKAPDTVVDLGCGTGLSTVIWKSIAKDIIGIEPSDEMRSIAKQKETENMRFVKGFAHAIPLADNTADTVICSQSFHWMEPMSTLKEVSRILKNGGIFATVDCDWPPVSDWRIEKAYTELFEKVRKIEAENPYVRDTFVRYSKDHHLANIQNSGEFRFAREIVFSNEESADAQRLINMALSQGSLQTILKVDRTLIESDVEQFSRCVHEVAGSSRIKIHFSYRMRIAVK